ncbi:inhibitor of growth protein 5-like isoform X1 [Halichondria panicea]|uniref:inhibitor of growth protein 5-like isoform X1 n=1 Tax=Halichondria panicea TaxID=6063 RepID=UPI00312B8F88
MHTIQIIIRMAVAAYLDKYFECVEYLPLEIQRCLTELRDTEMESRVTSVCAGAVEDVKSLKTLLSVAVHNSGDEGQQVVLFRRLQSKLLLIRDLGNRKLQVSSRLLETVDDYEQQLLQKQKAVDSSSTIDEFYHAQKVLTSGKELSGIISSAKRSSGTKRVRPVDLCNDEDTPNNARSAKKKIKTIRKKTSTVPAPTPGGLVASVDESSPPVPAVPMPDLSSQPLDPNEPTYCLCQQVSFGEMIGCDNDDCSIEWFHFQCVNLTSKPKGKWFCPQCAQGRRGSKPVNRQS